MSIDDVQPKTMKRKYDKRCKSAKSIAATEGAARSTKQLGRKPNWMKHISRNSAYEIWQECDSIASAADIYAYCWEKKLIGPLLQMREYVWNRLEGRPFVAINPADSEKPKGLLQDNRLQLAIQQLVIAPSEARRKTAKQEALRLPATS